MKKFFILVMALSLGFISCGEKDDDPEQDPTPNVGQEQEKVKEATWTISTAPTVSITMPAAAAEKQQLEDKLKDYFQKGDQYDFQADSCVIKRGGSVRRLLYSISNNQIIFDGYIKFNGWIGLKTETETLLLSAGVAECKDILKKQMENAEKYSADEIDMALKVLTAADIRLVFTKD
jgi:uncharacterized UBP type Zn finger protein